jgi:putative transposase
LDLPRSTYYHAGAGESEENLQLMRLIDEQYQHTPFYGSRGMTQWLIRQGYELNERQARKKLASARRQYVACLRH